MKRKFTHLMLFCLLIIGLFHTPAIPASAALDGCSVSLFYDAHEVAMERGYSRVINPTTTVYRFNHEHFAITDTVQGTDVILVVYRRVNGVLSGVIANGKNGDWYTCGHYRGWRKIVRDLANA